MLWLFLPFVLLVSGVVAYAADKIAKRVGRKHVRWFGLRPKETATIVAVLSGIGISAASLAAFLLLNRNAVSTIAQADQLRPQIEALRKEVGSVQKDLDAVQLERDAARKDAAQMVKDRAQAVQELQAARAGLSAAQASKQKVEAQRAELQQRVSDLTTLRKNLEGQAAQSRTKLAQSEQALKASQNRAQNLDAQVLDLSLRSATAEQEAQNAQSRAAEAQRKSDAAQAQALAAQDRANQARQKAVQVQQQAQAQVAAQQALLTDLSTRLQKAKTQLSAARQAAQTALTAQQQAVQARDNALAASRAAQAQQEAAQAERDRLTTQRSQLIQERTQATRDRDQVRQDLSALRIQQKQLRSSNAALAQQLTGTRQSLDLLRSQYRSTTTELSVSRNADLAYPKNDLVYAGVVPSVRNLDTFLTYAAQAAESRGARGNDQGAAVRLDKASRAALETKLRGLNTSSFVLCRATQNSSAGFPVDLSCDARPNTVLYRGGQIIRRVTLNLSPGMAARGGNSTQAQINELVQDTVLDLTSRGVPADYIDNQGLDVTEFASLLAKLSGSTGSVVVGLAAHDDVKPASRVDLYAVLP